MALYTHESIEALKAAVDMVELVGGRTDLRRVGSRYQGVCPFHDDRSPSFSVNPDPGLYHCFGCGASGDAIRFVQETEGFDFPQAVEHLADRYNVRLAREEEDPRAVERRQRRERLLALVDRTASFYARFLWESDEAAGAREYLASRGLEERVLRDFRVGWSPAAWDRVVGAALRDGYSPDEVVASGLARRGRNGKLYDGFRERIMFPLADARGRVVGFGARTLREDQPPKYLNTSENELFQKGRNLFGLDRARASAAKEGHAIVVEGYTDVLALHGAGVTHAVAVMGTALTQEQLAELARYARRVHLALDADRAGREAMLRSARMAEKRDLELLVVDLPEGADPADLVVREGADAFGRRLAGARAVPDFAARRVLAEADLSTARGRDAALAEIRPLVAELPDRSAIKDELVRFVADRLDVPTQYLEVTRIGTRTAAAGRKPVSEGSRGVEPARPAELSLRRERDFLAMCVAQPRAGREHLERLRDDHLSSQRLREVRDWLAGHLEDPLSGLPADEELVAAVHEVVARADSQSYDEGALRVQFLWLEEARLERQIKEASAAGDVERERALVDERVEVRAEANDLMGAVA